MRPEGERSATIAGVVDNVRLRLERAGIKGAALDARVLVQHVLGIDHAHVIANPERALSGDEVAAIEAAVARRCDREPVSRIVGRREFYGRDFEVTPDVLDPRADSEALIEQALAAAREIAGNGECLVLDVGTGSGALIVSLLAELPGARGVASDVSAAALAVARANAQRHGVESRLRLVETCWMVGISERFDIVMSNPPYIASGDIAGLARDVRGFDPLVALDGGADGLTAYRAIVPTAFEALKPGGVLCLEIGAGQADDVWAMMEDAGFSAHPRLNRQKKDLAGCIRVVTGWKS
jgi:release factor glutamine methyltransferase